MDQKRNKTDIDEDLPSSANLEFRQLIDQESNTFTYLLGDKESRECVLIDPVYEQVERDDELMRQMGYNLKYLINTHVHADHRTGSGLMKTKWPGSKSVLGETGNEKSLADIKVPHGDSIEFGPYKLEMRSTPGHTNGCYSPVLKMADKIMAFTGDALLIRGCGRTDFQQGNSNTLYESVHTQILSLPDETIVYPAHDYKGRTSSTVYEEKRFNPRLTKTKEEFAKLMKNLNLPYPKQIDVSLPWNIVCGVHELVPEDAPKKN